MTTTQNLAAHWAAAARAEHGALPSWAAIAPTVPGPARRRDAACADPDCAHRAPGARIGAMTPPHCMLAVIRERRKDP